MITAALALVLGGMGIYAKGVFAERDTKLSPTNGKKVESFDGVFMPEFVSIPAAFVEFEIAYERPNFNILFDRILIVKSVFEALMPWQPVFDDVDGITTGKNSEQGFTIKLPLKRISFFIGPVSCKFTRENVNWQLAQETIVILATVVNALKGATSSNFRKTTVSIAMHLQPKSMPFMELLRPFLSPKLVALDSEPISTMATVAKWAHRKVTVDGSLLLANAIFLRLDREFPGEPNFEEMAQQLLKDQLEVFQVLGVEEDQT